VIKSKNVHNSAKIDYKLTLPINFEPCFCILKVSCFNEKNAQVELVWLTQMWYFLGLHICYKITRYITQDLKLGSHTLIIELQVPTKPYIPQPYTFTNVSTNKVKNRCSLIITQSGNEFMMAYK
jgi:hypothetical protein